MVRIACIGGFLGAGKTTALVQAGRHLISRGIRVGMVTNDQGRNLVDTALMRALGFSTEEITGGCFCCNFKEFLVHADRLVEQHRPDLILAEAVGSCTDLAAAVYEPLRKYHASKFELAPLCVFVDPLRIKAFFTDEPKVFDASVRYLFQKQLAEADLIILNKSDLVSRGETEESLRHIEALAGDVLVYCMSARTGWGVGEWVNQLWNMKTIAEKELELDYAVYAQAEASLGWLNATVDLRSARKFSLRKFAESLVNRIQKDCSARENAIAHVKLLLATEEGSDGIAVTDNRARAMWSGGRSLGLVLEATMIINARVGTRPEALKKIVEDALASVAGKRGVLATIQDIESFSPPAPHRPYDVAVSQ